MAKSFEENVKDTIGSLVFQLVQAQTQVTQLMEDNAALEAKVNGLQQHNSEHPPGSD